MFKFIIFLFSFGMSVIGFTYVIAYLNLLSMGFDFFDYFRFISLRGECLISVIGLLIMSIIILGGKDKDGLCI